MVRNTLGQCPEISLLFRAWIGQTSPVTAASEKPTQMRYIFVAREASQTTIWVEISGSSAWMTNETSRRADRALSFDPPANAATPAATSSATGNASRRKRRKASQPGADRIARPAIARTAAGVQSASTYSPTEAPRAVHTLAKIAATNQSPVAAVHKRHAHPTLLRST